MAEYMDRRQIKREAREILRGAQVSPKAFFALYLALAGLMELASFFANGGSGVSLDNPLGMFVQIFVSLLSLLLEAGCWLYCMALRRGERAEYLTLFDGFSFAGRIIVLQLLIYLLVFLWVFPAGMIFAILCAMYGQVMVLFSPLMLLLLIPALVALYRYRFAILNLCADPALKPTEAIELSKRQTFGYKAQLFALDLSFLPWILLSYLPILYLYLVEYMSLWGYSMPEPGYGLSIFLQVAVPIAVGVFYLPCYRVAELGYFERAQRTSGTQPDARDNDQGPDDLGGYF
jgi:uncharacterized membrane protein